MSETPESYPQRPGRPADLSEWEIDAEQVAENPLQREIVNVLVSSLKELIAARGWKNVQVLCNTFFAWLPERPMVRVSPDVYLLDAPPKRLPGMWQTWKPENRPPFWALEILSEDWHKDYDQVPPKYEELGCRELVVFDPDAAMGLTNVPRRVPLTIYRRTAEGKLAVEYSGRGPAFSQELGVWLVPGREGYSARLRLSEDEAGTRLVPTGDEKSAAKDGALAAKDVELEAERSAKEQERAAKEEERAAKEKERAGREAAEATVARLEQQLREKKPS